MTDLKDKKSIVIYFSRADENYGVGYIEKWNTEVIAEYIQELVWADLFKVERKTPYAKEKYKIIWCKKSEKRWILYTVARYWKWIKTL